MSSIVLYIFEKSNNTEHTQNREGRKHFEQAALNYSFCGRQETLVRFQQKNEININTTELYFTY